MKIQVLNQNLNYKIKKILKIIALMEKVKIKSLRLRKVLINNMIFKL